MLSGMTVRRRRLALALLLCGLPGPLAAAGADGAGLGAAARALAPGERLSVRALLAGAAEEEVLLELVRADTAAPGARLVLHGAAGTRERPLPPTVHLRGGIVGRPGSRVALSVHQDGELRALLVEPGGMALARAGAGGELRFRPGAAAPDAPPFACAADGLEGPDGEVEELLPLTPAFEAATAVAHTARVALESDYEYFQKFDDATAAAEYALDLLAFSSTIYAGELGTDLAVVSVSLWTTAADPWAQTSTSCGFYEFGGYWNQHHAGDQRTLAHFLSGKASGGGIAWVGVLCSGAFETSGVSCAGMASSGNYGGAYGLTGNLSGTFDPGSPTSMWDIIAVSHEIGHNFGSPHTHCYAGYGGVSEHVDQCATSTSTGCYASGAKTLPGPGSVVGGSPGQHNGTLMSYCHLLSGGYANIELSFGLDHPYGVAPERVPQRMAAHVAARAASYPSCLAPLAATAIFADDFESQTLAAWDLTVGL